VIRFKLNHKFSCKCGREHTSFIKKILVDSEAIRMIGEVAKELELGATGVIVEDANTKRVVGDQVKENLVREGYKVYEAIVNKPDRKSVNEARRVIVDRNASFTIGVGGTSVLDVTKAASYEAGISDKRDVPYLTVSTTAANDGLASATASIYESKGGVEVKVSERTNPPTAVMVDLDVILSTLRGESTSWMVPAGCGDMVGKVTSLKDWELGREERGEYYCSYIADLARASLSDALKNGVKAVKGSVKALKEYVHSLINSGMAMVLAESSRPCSGSEHLFAHALEAQARATGKFFGRHGEQVAVGTLLMALHHMEHNKENWWIQREYQPDYILGFLRSVNCPTTIEQLNVPYETALTALVNAPKLRPERFTILHRNPLNESSAEALLRRVEELNT